MPKILFVLVFLPLLQAKAMPSEALLQRADSLFDAQQYVQAYDTYAQLYEDDQVSLQMLLKMAYIQEGLGDHARAVHFLLEHHARTQDATVWDKIAQLSQEKGFRGYTLRDKDHVWHFLLKHQGLLLGGVAVLWLVFCVRFLYRCFRQRPRGLVPMLVCAGLCVVALYLERWSPKTAVIGDDQTALMQAPAAAAQIRAQLQKGDRVVLLAHNKAWATILWDKQKGYIRTQHILYAAKKDHNKNERSALFMLTLSR